ncbi:TetR/AcrR family transcriptional regulator [Aeromicrobium sp.]|uniref:TetR/AcrR family transcriptional regulator n=1 Tax=Aeromicrobium sp. TaxID=1871063 RepID=UPI0019B26112|nr:TetR/AcrR family transcriptional regulator [Aeromicrobium sp.]MBC7631890.1 TetR/AcrR family transcriptional regulator [Aeromicrobium sp.]
MEQTSRTARHRTREEITEEILRAARKRLTEAGPGELSLRAVARDVGMVSSAVYRYFPSRDDLLTSLLILAYDEIGAAVEDADHAVSDRADLLARWTAACHAIRDWAVTHPGDYALTYGSPVAGYIAPRDTVGPATRGTVVLVTIVTDAYRDGRRARPAPPGARAGLEKTLGDAMRFVQARDLPHPPPEVVARTIMAWTSIFGTVSFELFGHLEGSVSDKADWFDEVVLRLAVDLGLT